MKPRTEGCAVCAGKGIVPHEKRKMENGEVDPADFRVHELCGMCGGSGVVEVGAAKLKELAGANS
mgnify:CR=1 FL=1